ncbi:hypothetical protein E0I26_12145 [Flavobacterium rhamnosiphilum]|uniref:Uncharacterized protein n=1 Tax=Flavobacterium rhamnosiphilum TaxID=2541724 RepID=A0A4R5F5E6_9FLAO|nr:hypothetical protein [Flavobacterium rhamnosiphilum]TDE42918.1 hypothetical protein E0I26_12145 [Flavobacterium rhamnosiphilum]
MKHSWRIFEFILSGIQICCGLVILFFVYITCTEYYIFLWKNPLVDHQSIVQMALRTNSTLVIVSLIAISSALLLIKNVSKGWVMSIITWIMFVVILIINSYRLNLLNPSALDLVSKFILGVMAIGFTTIVVLLNNIEFRQKYKPTKNNWIVIAISITALTALKFL